MLLRCYPRVTDFIYQFFNQSPAADYRFLPVFSYGFWVAVGFFAAASLAVIEMRRREALKLLTGKETQITVGAAPSIMETAIYFALGFIAFFKLVGLVVYQPELSSGLIQFPVYIRSLTLGSWAGGIIGGVAIAGYYYYSANKSKLPHPEAKTITIYPSDSIGDLLIIALVLGVLGSVLFNFLESPEDYRNFWSDPIGSLFSGLSIYGGLICAGAGFWIYARIKKFNLPHFLDSVAPGVALANGLGRLGCQTAGDGDWGIANPYPKPSWMPQFLWSQTYPHNIIDADPANIIPNCHEEHCHFLAHAVYPTPIYEFLMLAAVFLILWSIRKKLTPIGGMLFCAFLVLTGIERFSIEQWRDLEGRDLYHIFGLALRQSEIISIVIIAVGLSIAAYLYSQYRKTQPAT